MLPDGTERPFPVALQELEPTQDQPVALEAQSESMTAEELRAARRVPRVKTLRRALALTQEEFASKFHIPLGTVRDWEQGRCEPDQPARAYLKVIAHDPEGVSSALAQPPHRPC